MKRIWFALLLLCSLPVFGQTAAITGFCTSGSTPAKTQGLNSTNQMMGIVPSCTFSVYLTGTTTLATIFSDGSGTVLPNPFTASSTGQWLFYSAINQGYDVTLSGGIPVYVGPGWPVTITGLYPAQSITTVAGCGLSGTCTVAQGGTGATTAAGAAANLVNGNPISPSTITPTGPIITANPVGIEGQPLYPVEIVPGLGSTLCLHVWNDPNRDVSVLSLDCSGDEIIPGSFAAGGTIAAQQFAQPTILLTSPPACTTGTYWLAPIAGSTNAWQQCNNGTLSALGSGGGSGAGVVNAGSSLATAVTTCGSTPTIIQITQALTPSNLTVPENCALLIQTGGAINPSSGQTVIINGPIMASNGQQIFGGLGTVQLGAANTVDYPEWWGGKNDGAYGSSSGTNNAAALQAAVNAFVTTVTYPTGTGYATGGGTVMLQGGACYNVASTITINSSEVGIRGVGGRSSCIQNTTASADTLDVWGTSGTFILQNQLRDFGLLRTVAPTGTAAGLSLQYSGAAVVDDILSQDSIYDVNLNSVNSWGSGIIQNVTTQTNLTTSGGGPYYGFYVNSRSGVGNASLRLLHNTYTYNGTYGVSYGLMLTGNNLRDFMSEGFESAYASYGIAIVYSPSGGVADDIHFNNSINDTCTVACLYVSGLTDAIASRVFFSGGYDYISGSGVSADVESSNGINIDHIDASGQIKINGGGGNTVTHVSTATTAPIVLTSTSNNLISDLNANGISTVSTLISGTGVTNSIFKGILARGLWGTAISLDATSSKNAICANDFTGSGITTPLSSAQSSPVPCDATAVPGISITSVLNIPMKDGTGTTATDVSLFGNNATITAGTGGWTTQTGLSQGAYSFDGSTTLMTLSNYGYLTFDRNNSFSVSVVFNATSTIGSGLSEALVSRLNTASNYQGWELGLNNQTYSGNGNYPVVFLVNTFPSNSIEQMYDCGAAPVSINTLHSLLYTYSGTSTAAGGTMYLDGVACTAEVATQNSLTATMQNTVTPVIGGRINSTALFKGKLGPARVWNRVLTATEAATLAATPYAVIY